MAPAVFAVSSGAGDGAAGSLRAAINLANTNGDASNTITLGPGAFPLTAAGGGSLLIQDQAAGLSNKSLTIVGEGELQSTIEAQGAFRIMQVVGTPGASSSVVFDDVILSGGVAQWRCARRNGGSRGRIVDRRRRRRLELGLAVGQSRVRRVRGSRRYRSRG